MKGNKLLTIIFAIILVSGAAVPLARADEADQQTKITFSEPVEIPGQVLPAGTYWFVLDRNSSNRHIVRIYSADWKTLYATELAIPAERLQVTDNTAIKFAETVSAPALLTWFYPGELTGHEFLYPKAEARELAQDTQQTVIATPPQAGGQVTVGF